MSELSPEGSNRRQLKPQEFFDPSTGVAHFAFDDVGSTNDEAFRLGIDRSLDVTFVTAKRQLSGRGRRGRAWVSEPGNLYTSVFLRQPALPERCAELSFVAAVSLLEAIKKLSGEKKEAVELKWPNDVLWHGAKIAGLLLEAREHEGAMNIVIGMGTNCAHHPADTPYPTTDLNAEGVDGTPDALFALVKQAFMKHLSIWNRGEGFDEIRRIWTSHARGIGKEIVVRLEREEVRGLFKGLDHDGSLILSTTGKAERHISAGDVFFPDFLGS